MTHTLTTSVGTVFGLLIVCVLASYRVSAVATTVQSRSNKGENPDLGDPLTGDQGVRTEEALLERL